MADSDKGESPSPVRRERRCFAVVRHAERADDSGFWDAGGWWQSPEGLEWPHDPPLTEVGLQQARAVGSQLSERASASSAQADETSPPHSPENALDTGAGRSPSEVHVVVSSPYMRCVQTAVEICRAIGDYAVLVIDYSLGEVYGAQVFGDQEPQKLLRPREEVQAYCKARGVSLRLPEVGKMPEWPEQLESARVRLLDRFLRYLKRSSMANRNFTLVLHADGVASALSAMPATRGRGVERVGYCGFFVGETDCERTRSISSDGLVSLESRTSRKDSALESVDSVEASLTNADGWKVHISPSLTLGPAPSEGFVKRVQRLAKQTSRSETSIMRLLHCLPQEPLAMTRQTSEESSPSRPSRSPSRTRAQTTTASDGFSPRARDLRLFFSPREKDPMRPAEATRKRLSEGHRKSRTLSAALFMTADVWGYNTELESSTLLGDPDSPSWSPSADSPIRASDSPTKQCAVAQRVIQLPAGFSMSKLLRRRNSCDDIATLATSDAVGEQQMTEPVPVSVPV